MASGRKSGEFVILSGSANRGLAEAVCAELHHPLGQCRTERFPDGEVGVEIEESVRGLQVFLIQPTSPPVNDHVVELMALADACRRASAKHVAAVIPYFGYARADRRKNRRIPIMARAVAELLEASGVDQIAALDLHSPQVEGFFQIPVETLTAMPTLAEALRPGLVNDPVIVAPDLGAAERAAALGEKLGCSVAVLAKRRLSGREVEIKSVIGQVEGRHCLIFDDMISTGGTILKAAEALFEAGCRPEIRVVATHAVFRGEVPRRFRAAGITEILVTDTIDNEAARQPGVSRVSVAPLLAEAVGRLVAGESLKDLL
ncbi:MAG: ribose-phosphate diphosphokinase [Gemmatimonas sp.]|nr:ribose-phosphate diphosphokinase [Gemmatimonas sp.]